MRNEYKRETTKWFNRLFMGRETNLSDQLVIGITINNSKTVITSINSRFVNVTFKDCDLTGSFFHQCEFEGCTFERCSLNHSSFLYKTFLSNTVFTDCSMKQARFKSVLMRTVKIDGCYVLGTNFRDVNATACCINKTDFTDCCIRESTISKINIDGCIIFVDNLFSNSVDSVVLAKCQLFARSGKYRNTLAQEIESKSSRFIKSIFKTDDKEKPLEDAIKSEVTVKPLKKNKKAS